MPIGFSIVPPLLLIVVAIFGVRGQLELWAGGPELRRLSTLSPSPETPGHWLPVLFALSNLFIG
ncbi:MAG TPA: hypothetical protein PLM24_05230 [Methanothrix sp.]|nr:hypothetical protein [Methanothrix sp.]HPR66521.1 hypothetical protein [Methanothrix sp.]